MSSIAAPMKNVIRDLSSPLPASVFVAAISALYYATYIDAGFNFSDAGNYAQISYELFLGRDVQDLAVSYGVLWFKAGEILFRTFGVDYSLINLFFYACITVTNILVFYVVYAVTRNTWMALGAAFAAALVPAFPPTAFYAFCILINVAAQIRMATGSLRFKDAALAGLILAITFQIRPDFGYIFIAPLAALIVLAAFTGAARAITLVAGVASGFLGTLLVGIVAAFIGGYESVFFQQLFSYPGMMAAYLVDGVRALFFDAATVPGSSAGLLKRPTLVAIFSGDMTHAALTILIYLPIVILLVFAVWNLRQFLRSGRGECFTAGALAIVVLSGAAAALPHYFFYRPDLPHIANFMPGYIVMLAVFAVQLQGHYRHSAPSCSRVLAAGIGVILALNLGIYMALGLTSPGTGSRAVAIDRTEKFHAGNGVDVSVTPAEKDELTFLRDIVWENSRTGDEIVCLPYCPGIAFMTERQMLLRNFYVDDTVLAAQPYWIDNAIRLTRRARPPVIIVIDWAVNGAERSRFPVWADRYVSAAQNLSRRAIVNGSITVYIL